MLYFSIFASYSIKQQDGTVAIGSFFVRKNARAYNATDSQM